MVLPVLSRFNFTTSAWIYPIVASIRCLCVFSFLRLLKEKQEREDRSNSSNVLSPCPSSVRSPPPKEKESVKFHEDLPLLQRVLLLKKHQEEPVPAGSPPISPTMTLVPTTGVTTVTVTKSSTSGSKWSTVSTQHKGAFSNQTGPIVWLICNYRHVPRSPSQAFLPGPL